MSSMISGKNIYWSKKYESVVNRLVGKDREDRRKAFETNMDVLVFAAVLGMKEASTEKVSSDRLEISIDVFNNRRTYGLIYLVALLHTQDANIFRQERESEMLSIFQEYAMGGLALIQSWLDEQPTDIYGDKVLMEKLQDQLANAKSTNFSSLGTPVSF